VNGFFSFRCQTWCWLIVSVGMAMGCSLKTAVVPAPTAIVQPSVTVECEEGFNWPDNDLRSRFQQYWTLRQAGNAAGSFEYEAPHVRAMVIWGRYERYVKRLTGDLISIRVDKINNKTEQLIDVDFNMVVKNKEKKGTNRDAFFRDSWLLFSGQWFHVLKDPFVTGDGLGS